MGIWGWFSPATHQPTPPANRAGDLNPKPDKTKFTLEGAHWSTGLGAAVVVGIVALAFHAFSQKAFWPVLSASILYAGAYLLIGVLFGFLFGIPRSLQNPEEPVSSENPVAAKSRELSSIRSRYGANTNLEQISDWLTKILVGVGLTQIHQIPEQLRLLAAYMSPSLGDSSSSSQISLAIVLYFFVCGFLLGYLWTRIFLGGELTRAEIAAISEKVKEDIADANEQQMKLDAKAIGFVNRYLSSPNSIDFSVDDMKSAIINASLPVKINLFYTASNLRRANWRSEKAQMERTIPIFEALKEFDKTRHELYGELGFAMKDKTDPDYAASEAYLSEAIKKRGPLQEFGSGMYEFSRALCRIQLDSDFVKGLPTSDKARADQIRADIIGAKDYLQDEFPGGTEIDAWLKLNPE